MRLSATGAVCVTLAFLLPAGGASAGSQPADSGAEQTSGNVPWAPRYPSTPLPKVGKGLITVNVLDDAGHLQTSRLETITIEVKKAGNGAVVDADIKIAAKARDVMRQMLTEPRVTKNLGAGQYRVEGLRFSMAGSWLLEFDIKSGSLSDKALVELVIK